MSENGHHDADQANDEPSGHSSSSVTSAGSDTFQEAVGGDESPAKQEDSAALPQAAETGEDEHSHDAPAARPVDDNATLAALAASSTHGTPVQDADLDPNAPSFILVASLRSQITDLTSQVTSLNSKLVSSYTRIGDLDDDLHDRTDEVTHFKARVAALEKNQSTWQKEIEVGGWVERVRLIDCTRKPSVAHLYFVSQDHVQTEMRGLMTKVLEETKSRESAVEAHSKLETEIENLTSSLFTEANKMVAVERFARARAEEKMRSLEESSTVMTGLFEEVQTTMRETVDKLESRERDVAEMKQRLADAGISSEDLGDASDGAQDSSQNPFPEGDRIMDVKSLSVQNLRPSPPGTPSRSFRGLRPPRLNTSVLPYNEFVAFVTYLRQLRVTVLSRPQDYAGHPHPYTSSSISSRGFGVGAHSPAPPTTLPPIAPAVLLSTHLPLSSHLSQPFVKRCVEEDSDPSLRLDLAPGLGFLSRRNVSTAIVDGTLLIEPTYSGSTLPSTTCALCGTALERWWAGGEIVSPATATKTMRKVLGGGGWGIPNFSGTSRAKDTTTTPSSPVGGEGPFSFSNSPNQQIHIFRINDTSTARYAICPTYCLPRLRAVCEFWTYIRAMERGLLLEEGFHFVGGKGVNGALVESRSSGSNLSLVSKSKSSLVGVKSVENLASSATPAAGFAPKDRLVGDHPVQVVFPDEVLGEQAAEDPAAKAEEGKSKKENEGEKESQAEDIGEKTELKVTIPDAATDEEEKPKTSSDAVEGAPESSSPPLMSVPPSPVIGGNTSSSSLNKPPVPKRSEARPPTPNPNNFNMAGNVNPAPAPSPPKLPPRNPTHSGGAKATSGGHKAMEIGGTVDAMEIVGGATGWEDRCWAEVVRLKESIFWTRMARESAEV
ncbi:Rab guanine nucleotide exchange factor SEC2, partial [Phenoliferia sp. Uapishka_3]